MIDLLKSTENKGGVLQHATLIFGLLLFECVTSNTFEGSTSEIGFLDLRILEQFFRRTFENQCAGF
jgi:hypothetical protein